MLAGTLIVSACGGSKTDLAADATKAADTPPQTSFDLVAKSDKFNETILVAKADTQIKVSLSNQDGGTMHNFSIYKDKSAKDSIHKGEFFEGKKIVDDTFQSPAAGIYFFRCDVHPDAMTGTFIAR